MADVAAGLVGRHAQTLTYKAGVAVALGAVFNVVGLRFG